MNEIVKNFIDTKKEEDKSKILRDLGLLKKVYSNTDYISF